MKAGFPGKLEELGEAAAELASRLDELTGCIVGHDEALKEIACGFEEWVSVEGFGGWQAGYAKLGDTWRLVGREGAGGQSFPLQSIPRLVRIGALSGDAIPKLIDALVSRTRSMTRMAEDAIKKQKTLK